MIVMVSPGCHQDVTALSPCQHPRPHPALTTSHQGVGLGDRGSLIFKCFDDATHEVIFYLWTDCSCHVHIPWFPPPHVLTPPPGGQVQTPDPSPLVTNWPLTPGHKQQGCKNTSWRPEIFEDQGFKTSKHSAKVLWNFSLLPKSKKQKLHQLLQISGVTYLVPHTVYKFKILTIQTLY